MNSKLIALIFLCAGLTVGAQDSGLRRFGMFVRSNDGGKERITLAWAASDANAVMNVLQEVGGVSARDALLLTDPDARELSESFTQMAEAIDAAKILNRRVEFVFYYIRALRRARNTSWR